MKRKSILWLLAVVLVGVSAAQVPTRPSSAK
jgi:hypothetical protein